MEEWSWLPAVRSGASDPGGDQLVKRTGLESTAAVILLIMFGYAAEAYLKGSPVRSLAVRFRMGFFRTIEAERDGSCASDARGRVRRRAFIPSIRSRC